MTALEEEVGVLLKEKGLSLGIVESATGGLISHLITAVPGSSEYYKGSITAYSNDVKIRLVGVSVATINSYGAVSPRVAEEMARRGRRVLESDICLSDTGIAGPGGATDEKPVGLFYLGLSHGSSTLSRKHLFKKDRSGNKKAAAEAALNWLKQYLKEL